jgi:hypothetical protein
VSGVRGDPLPTAGGTAPDLGLARSESPLEVVSATIGALAARPAIVGAAAVLALTAVLLPDARARGGRAVAALALAQLTLLVLVAPSAWVTAIAGTVALVAVLAAPRGLMRVRSTSGCGPERCGSRSPGPAPRQQAVPPHPSATLLGAETPQPHPIPTSNL